MFATSVILIQKGPSCSIMSGPDELKTPRRNLETSAAGNAIVMPRFNISFLAIKQLQIK